MSSWTAASSDCSRPVNIYVHVKTADLYRPNARLTPERQGYQVLTPFGKLGYSLLALKPNKGLNGMTELVEAGKVVPSIDDIYPLRDVPQAIRRFGEARHKGKIVIAIRGLGR